MLRETYEWPTHVLYRGSKGYLRKICVRSSRDLRLLHEHVKKKLGWHGTDEMTVAGVWHVHSEVGGSPRTADGYYLVDLKPRC